MHVQCMQLVLVMGKPIRLGVSQKQRENSTHEKVVHVSSFSNWQLWDNGGTSAYLCHVPPHDRDPKKIWAANCTKRALRMYRCVYADLTCALRLHRGQDRAFTPAYIYWRHGVGRTSIWKGPARVNIIQSSLYLKIIYSRHDGIFTLTPKILVAKSEIVLFLCHREWIWIHRMTDTLCLP